VVEHYNLFAIIVVVIQEAIHTMVDHIVVDHIEVNHTIVHRITVAFTFAQIIDS
jgi:hypothetical protein